ncbi:MAG: metallophosphoesterase [Actinobacteria bacterium]|nr:metallophosphoesterase [Actinomycetota bacterium]
MKWFALPLLLATVLAVSPAAASSPLPSPATNEVSAQAADAVEWDWDWVWGRESYVLLVSDDGRRTWQRHPARTSKLRVSGLDPCKTYIGKAAGIKRGRAGLGIKRGRAGLFSREVEGKPTGTCAPKPPPTPAPVIAAAGDIADDGSGDEATAKVIDAINPTRVLTTGDHAYPDGTIDNFNSFYEPTWGRHKSLTRPSPGNHDYHVSGAPGYFDYFGAAAGERGKGYYSYDLGSWHVVALNSNVSTAAGSAQEQWLRADLAAHPNRCTLAYWHHPRFTSGSVHDNNTAVGPLWQALYDAGADVVLNGHNHNYERFGRQDPSGQADAQQGIREFVVGTGGGGHYGFDSPKPNSEVRNGDSYGVLKLTLRDEGYDWRFEPEAGKTFTDTGSAGCSAYTPPPSPNRYPLRGVFEREADGTFDAITARGFNLIDSSPGEVGDLAATAPSTSCPSGWGPQTSSASTPTCATRAGPATTPGSTGWRPRPRASALAATGA